MTTPSLTARHRVIPSRSAADPPLDLLSELANEQRGPLGRARALFPRVPHVARADRQAHPVRGERGRGGGSAVARVLAEPLFDLVVSDGGGAVRAATRICCR